jgi:hypothetical protein
MNRVNHETYFYIRSVLSIWRQTATDTDTATATATAADTDTATATDTDTATDTGMELWWHGLLYRDRIYVEVLQKLQGEFA